MRYVTVTEFRQQASRILNDKRPTAILRNGKIEGCYVPAESLAFDTTDDARMQELTRSILDQRSEALRYLANR
ncbi:MAG: type II toxin-antitoxin system Phd/YefM family antitoxin [Gammaproteobacteria bacterium]|nr:type II toxin-antitoxin system Phd/YefM family antitoxin [Gammaproteobacteria bacterium]MYE52318.1 type II toxin-antitoxin system Phd/YefM family antitoxin [Gammaproteobacteria bacterium]MYF51681.1 type II toxin-antitoxin system Phd/YefM family antitoxin [Gammaproteobacteria bacterium]MYK27472.1 type II toxin-antitoxin system Phd/YefM family antitoxin [Gammaproteobacteria bacterium]